MRRLASCTAAIFVALFGLVATGQNVLAQNNNNSSSYNWSGYYGGVNLGGAFGGSDVLSIIPSGLPFFEGQLYPGVPVTGNPAVIAAFRSNDIGVKGFTGGLQAGYNFWSGGFLWGLEVDVNFMNLKGSKTSSAYGFPAIGTLYTFRNEMEADYIITARPRAGMLVGGGLLYATGGVALTTLNYSHAFRATGGLADGLFENASFSETKIGWTAGAGYELPISRTATLKAEYLFTSFGSGSSDGNKIFPLTTAQFPTGLTDAACGADTGQFNTPTPRQCMNHKADLFLHTIRMGLNFKF